MCIIVLFYLYATFIQHSKKIHALSVLLLKSKTREKYFGGGMEREMTPYSSQMELASTRAKSEIDPSADRCAAGSLRVGT